MDNHFVLNDILSKVKQSRTKLSIRLYAPVYPTRRKGLHAILRGEKCVTLSSLENRVRWHRLFRGNSLQGSHDRAFRALLSHFVARGIRTCCASTCRYPSCFHPGRRPSVPPSLSSVIVWSQSLTNPTNRASSSTRDTCVPHQPDTCRAQCRRRARRTHGTLMVTVTDHVGPYFLFVLSLISNTSPQQRYISQGCE